MSCLSTISCSPSIIPHAASAIANTGASDHYFAETTPLINTNPFTPHTTIRTATGEQQTLIATAQLAIPALPTNASQLGHIIPGFKNSLISIGKLCNADCTAMFDKKRLTVQDSTGATILIGTCKHMAACLWRVDFTPQMGPAALLTSA